MQQPRIHKDISFVFFFGFSIQRHTVAVGVYHCIDESRHAEHVQRFLHYRGAIVAAHLCIYKFALSLQGYRPQYVSQHVDGNLLVIFLEIILIRNHQFAQYLLTFQHVSSLHITGHTLGHATDDEKYPKVFQRLGVDELG